MSLACLFTSRSPSGHHSTPHQGDLQPSEGINLAGLAPFCVVSAFIVRGWPASGVFPSLTLLWGAGQVLVAVVATAGGTAREPCGGPTWDALSSQVGGHALGMME
jgi:hypothetical protein